MDHGISDPRSVTINSWPFERFNLVETAFKEEERVNRNCNRCALTIFATSYGFRRIDRYRLDQDRMSPGTKSESNQDPERTTLIHQRIKARVVEGLERHRLVRGIVNSRKGISSTERNRKFDVASLYFVRHRPRKTATDWTSERAAAVSGTQRQRRKKGRGEKEEKMKEEEEEVGRRTHAGAPAPLILHTVSRCTLFTTPCRKQPRPPGLPIQRPA